MGLRPLVAFAYVATWACNSGSEFFDVLLGDDFPLNWCSLKWQWKNWDRVHSNFWSVHCPSAVCHSPRYSNYTVHGLFVPTVPRFQSSDFVISEYTICIADETFCTFVSHSEPNPELVSGMHSVHLLCQHFLTKWDTFLCRLSCHAVFQMVFSRHDLFGIWTGCILHAPPSTAE